MAKSAFPFLVEADQLFQSRVVSQPNEYGTQTVISSGQREVTEFVAVACNRMSESRKAGITAILNK